MFDKVKHEPGTKLAVLCLETEVNQTLFCIIVQIGPNTHSDWSKIHVSSEYKT